MAALQGCAACKQPLPYINVSCASFTHMPTACRRHYDIAPYSMSKSYQQAALVLAGSEWAVSSAQPLSPHIVLFGAVTAKGPQPLPPHLESFVGSAGEHGVVLASLGSTAIPGMSHVDSSVYSQLFKVCSAWKDRMYMSKSALMCIKHRYCKGSAIAYQRDVYRQSSVNEHSIFLSRIRK